MIAMSGDLVVLPTSLIVSPSTHMKDVDAILQVKAFPWSPFGNQLFWVRETFLKFKLPTPKFLVHGDQNGRDLEGWNVNRVEDLLNQILIELTPLGA